MRPPAYPLSSRSLTQWLETVGLIMAAKLPWFERRWTFNDPAEIYPDLLARLRGTPARIEDLVRELPTAVITRREREGTWSIQENIGHLVDLDELHAGRIEDYLSSARVLRPADPANRQTHEARHNDQPIGKLLAAFRRERGGFVSRLESLSPADFSLVAEHPRLKTPMRLVDMCRFTADHDDYHLARIHELLVLFRG